VSVKAVPGGGSSMAGKGNRPQAPGSRPTTTFSAARADLGWPPGEIIQFHFVNGGLPSDRADRPHVPTLSVIVGATARVVKLVHLLVGSPHWLNSDLSRAAACLPRTFLTIRTKLARQA
jgi:hypothetical protein